MQRPLRDEEIEDLRRLAADVNSAIEARIRNEEAAGEKVRRATQALQIAGMGEHQYWESQISQPLKSVCLIIAQELGVLPAINAHSGPITAREVAEKVNSEEILIIRIMRVLSSVGITEETARDTYLPNGLSRIAASQGGQAGVKIWNELLFPVAAQLVPYMRQHGFKQFPRRPAEMDPTQWTHGGRTMFEYFKDEPEIKGWFDTLMVSNRASNMPWFEIYPFASEVLPSAAGSSPPKPDEVLLVDVGGNRGADLLEFHQTFPDLPGRLVLQDLPETIAAVDAPKMGRIELQAYDFFTPQPVRGARAYFWRWVLHDFNDDQVRDFLPKTVAAMDSGSRLLIEELVLPDVGADVKCGHLDILMMLYHSGMERSESQWREVLDSCGLKVIKIWKRVDADPSVLECVLK